MTGISRQSLFGRLNPTCFRSLEAATAHCKLLGHSYVELVHWLQQLMELPDSDIRRILAAYEVDAGRLGHDVTRALDRLPRGATFVSDLSEHVEVAAQEAWLVASLAHGAGQIRSGHLLEACLSSRALSHVLLGISAEFSKLRPERLRDEFDRILQGSPEVDAAGPVAVPQASGAQAEVLARYTVDLTESARAGKLDPVIGRDAEMRRLIDVLMRRRQNNPVLTGEAGVGKTAVVEGLALKIAAGEVPPSLRDVSLLALDISLLQAGAGVKGEFEQRLSKLVEAVQAAPRPVILFMDELHMLVGAGGQEGTGDAANLLKPALARGALRTIGATTWAEYRRHIEQDAALSRRFQPIPVAEPDNALAMTMMRRMVASLERHHEVEILDEAVEAAVILSRRYIPARQLPDKALSLLDTACARVANSQHARPDPVAHQQRQLDALGLEQEILAREEAEGTGRRQRRDEVEAAITTARAELARLEACWQRDLERVGCLRRARAARRAGEASDAPPPPGSADAPPLVLDRVDRQAVAAIVQDWTGIPTGRLLKDEAATLLSLPAMLSARVIGQDQALEAIARRVQTSRAGLEDPAKPIGVFLLCGPSGVGKTETALALAEALVGGESNLITINMSEFQEAHTVSSLKGAPPGYVGHGQGGVLTEAVRRRPHAVILLDEVEKAHPDVHKLFFQVFDKGVMEDGEGRRIDFRNTLILLTSNIGSEEITRLCRPQGEGASPAQPEAAALEAALHRPLRQVFPPALLGRMVVLPYYPLSDAVLERVVRLQLGRIAERMMQAHDLPFTYSDGVVALIAARARQVDSGGRMIDAILTGTVLPTISRHILTHQGTSHAPGAVRLDVRHGEVAYDFGEAASQAAVA
ncbi:type VI secretion system ATPase TssH [Roseomonas marmotae]|uniref:Type VI secretion system ATPase TssH n=1 Tax=Roseomonas marmotae TaxID=2768161 RepID=A0ABS3K8A4_9PROT|nr:type VI secretion system ATPase TssH [Roseomonas marmotae]MBO1073706.1 type VI secretion system ATPase TssH [Roseomonas marmotae]QTI78655.1 type VI secretion system ATPase TssH [Roseomonas marmotae]